MDCLPDERSVPFVFRALQGELLVRERQSLHDVAAARGCQRRQADHRQIREVIRHERVTHRKDVEEAERRCQRAGIVQRRDQRPPADLPTRHVENDDHGHRRGREEILPPHACVDRPARIHEGERARPEKLPRVEPEGAPCHERPLDQRERPLLARGTHVVLFHPDRDRGHAEADDEQRHDPPRGASIDRTLLPPHDQQQHGGQ